MDGRNATILGRVLTVLAMVLVVVAQLGGPDENAARVFGVDSLVLGAVVLLLIGIALITYGVQVAD